MKINFELNKNFNKMSLNRWRDFLKNPHVLRNPDLNHLEYSDLNHLGNPDLNQLWVNIKKIIVTVNIK